MAFPDLGAIRLGEDDMPDGDRRQAVPPLQVARWPNVTFSPPGNISAVAFDAAGNAVATASVATTGPPAAVRITIVDIGLPTYEADGQDVAIFTVSVVDAAGALVTDACVPLTFTVASGPGDIYGIGNGDPADLTPDKVGHPDLPFGGVWQRSSWMGLARLIVQTQAGKPGEIVVEVGSPGLTTGTASFTSRL